MDLDRFSRALLYQLDQDSSRSFTELGRELGASHDRVRYRVQQLMAERIIWKCHASVDTAVLDLENYEFFLKCRGADDEKLQKIIKWLLGIPLVTWVVRTDGEFDIGFSMRVRKVSLLDRFIQDLLSRFSQLIDEKNMQLNTFCGYLSRDYLIGQSRRRKTLSHYMETERKVQLDAVSLAVLEMLGEDGRLSAAEIAGKLNDKRPALGAVSREMVALRLKRMEKERIISGYTIVLNHAVLGQLHYKVFMFLNVVRPAAVSKLLADCQSEPHVTYIIRSLGRWDMELDIEVGSPAQYRQIMARLMSRHGRTIRDYIALQITEIYKYDTGTALFQCAPKQE